MPNTIEQQGDSTTTWMRWAGGVILLIVVNFLSVAYYAGGNSEQTQSNTRRIDRIEQLLELSATKAQILDLKDDFKEMRSDIKEIGRDGAKRK